MAIRDSQDVTLVPAQNKGNPRVSQDVALVPAQNKGNPRASQDVALAAAQYKGAPRVSQDVILVLARRYTSGPIATAQAQQSLAATGSTSATVISCTQAAQSLAATGTVVTALRDSQDVTLVASRNSGNPRDSQDLTIALSQKTGNPRVSQDVILVLSHPRVQIICTQAQQSLDATGALSAHVNPDKPDRQLHPVVKPFDFMSRPLTQAGRRSATFTTVLTAAGASRAFSMPLGGRNRPVAGRVFTYAMGGSLVLGTVGGTLIIAPFYGATADGISLGPSAAYPYSADYATPTQWRLKGEIVFRQVDFNPGLSLVTCQGTFITGGDPKIPGSGLAIVFGSVDPLAVDADAVAPSASGALNFAATFAPVSMNAVAPIISTKYAFLRS